jgi:hypothetical protein
MHRFAHLADIHIGAFRQPVLQNLLLDAFNRAMDLCLEKRVDFIVISGDLFDSNIPDMGLLNSAVRKMGEVKESGIPFYVIYGSHDFSPTQTSIIDILESANLFTKVTEGEVHDGRLHLEFTTDERTGAKLCGISGRRRGIEREYYEILERESLERENGFKIFVLHGAISEYKSRELADAESISVSKLPRGFAYYAGGHLHERLLINEHGYNLAYPGTLFGTDFTDLERSAKGQERGFFLVSFSDKVEGVEFVPISVCGYDMRQYDASGKNSVAVQNELSDIVQSIEPEGKVVLLKVAGEMSGGKTSDVDFQQFKRVLKEKGALEVLPNYHKLTSKEYASIKVAGEDIHEIEGRLFRENIGRVKVSDPRLRGEEGVKLSRDVLRVLEQGKPENEGKASYEGRIRGATIEALGIREDFK